MVQEKMKLSPIKRNGIGFYELEDGSITDKGFYDLAIFLEKQQQSLSTLLGQLKHNKAIVLERSDDE